MVKTIRTVFALSVMFFLIATIALPQTSFLVIEIPEEAEGTILRLRKLEPIIDSTSGIFDLLAIGGNTLVRIEGNTGKTLWRTSVGDEAETTFLIENDVPDGKEDILAFYELPVSVLRINKTDGSEIETYEGVSNESVWELETTFIDLDGIHPQEIAVGASNSLSIVDSDFSEQFWNISFVNPRVGAVYRFYRDNGLPAIGTWIDEGNESTFLMLDGRNGSELWNLSLPRQGGWMIYRSRSVLDGLGDQVLFLSTQEQLSSTQNMLLLQCDNGSVVWQKQFGSIWYSVVQGEFSGSGDLDFLLAGDKEEGKPTLVALNGIDGTFLWEMELESSKLTAAEITGDTVTDLAFVSQQDILVIDGATREWLLEPKGFIASIQAVCLRSANDSKDPSVIVGLSDGTVHALNITSGDTLWTNDDLAENILIRIAKGSVGIFEVVMGLLVVSTLISSRCSRKKHE